MLAERAIEHGKMAAFTLWWAVTILLGGIFLADTGLEWYKLIVHDHLTIHTNLFGTTFYSLVGLHASHVIVGLIMMLVVLVFALARRVHPAPRRARESAGHVLALCRCRLGGCLQLCVHRRTMMEPRDPRIAASSHGEAQTGTIHLPAPDRMAVSAGAGAGAGLRCRW